MREEPDPDAGPVSAVRESMGSDSTGEAVVQRGVTLWLTGLPSAGKTTIGKELCRRLRERGRRAEMLDGDEVRRIFGGGFDREARDRNVARIGWIAVLLARNGVDVVVAAVSPFREARVEVSRRHALEDVGFVEIFAAASLASCTARDVKGLYARQRAGLLTGLTGVDDPYEAPLHPDIRLRTDVEDVDSCVDQVLSYLLASEMI